MEVRKSRGDFLPIVIGDKKPILPPVYSANQANLGNSKKFQICTIILTLLISLCTLAGVASWMFLGSKSEPPTCPPTTNTKVFPRIIIKGKLSPVCDSVPDLQKFDCHPDTTASESECVERGCCWNPVIYPNGFPPLNVPYCYYPKIFEGYRVLSITSTVAGQSVLLQRLITSGFAHDIGQVRVNISVLDEYRIRIKAVAEKQKRFEGPLSGVDTTRKVMTKNFQFEVSVTIDGVLTVLRRDTRTVVLTVSLARMVFSEYFIQVSAILPTTTVYGIGEHYGPVLKSFNWTRNTLFNRDRFPQPNLNLYGSHPFYVCIEEDGNANGLLLLNTNAMDVVMQPTPSITYRTIGGILDFYMLMGPTPNMVVQQYTEVVGYSFMPPYWSLGFQLCKYGYGSLNETKKVWQRTRDAGIPFDVQWNDIDYMERNNDFTYDKDKYRELPEFVKELHDNGMHYVMMVDPGVSGSEEPGTYPPYDEGIDMNVFIKNRSGEVFVGKVWNSVSTVFPDFSHPNSTAYWTKLFKDFHKEIPFDGAWIDMNEISNFYDGQIDGCPQDSRLEDPVYLPGDVEPLHTKTLCMTARHYTAPHYDEHNLHSFREARATNIALRQATGKRPFLISRSSSPGLGRYGGHWSGDIASSWKDMRYSVSSLLAFNIFGIPMMGSDICGFRGNTTLELCARWTTLGAFYPFSRNHNDMGQIDQDPVALGEVVTTAAKNALTIRYELLPYLYTLFFRSHAFGEMVVRPLAFEYPKDEKTHAIEQTFLWGPAVLIIPVLYSGRTTVTAYFPKDLWYDVRTRKQMQSDGQTFTLPAPLREINVFVRGGHIIPSQKPNLTTTESRRNPFNLFVALDSNGEAVGQLYFDNGDSKNVYSRREYNLVNFSVKDYILSTDIALSGYPSPMPLDTVEVCSMEYTPDFVEFNGEFIDFTFSEDSKCLIVNGMEGSLLVPNKMRWRYSRTQKDNIWN